MQGTIFLAMSPMEVNNIKTIRVQMGKTNKCKVICIDDMSTASSPDVICASILLPSANSLINMIDHEDPYANGQFIADYTNKLTNDPDIIEYLSILLAGVLQYGIDYIFYYDGTNDPIVINVLCSILSRYYGIRFVLYNDILANTNLLFYEAIDPRFIPNTMNLIHRFGYQVEDQAGKLFMNIS